MRRFESCRGRPISHSAQCWQHVVLPALSRMSVKSTPRRNHLDKASEVQEIFCVVGVEREVIGESDRGNEQIHHARAAGLASCRDHCSVDSAVCPGCRVVKRKRLERCLHALQPILTTGTFLPVSYTHLRAHETVLD